MNLTEKVAYIKGLAEGLSLDESKDEVKVINAIVDLLEDLAQNVIDLEENADVTDEMLDVLDEDLGAVEEVVYEVYDDGYDDYHNHHHHHECGCDDEELYEVTCPTCGNKICIDEEMLDEGQISCSNCGEVLEFDFDEVDLAEENFEESESE